MILILLFYKPNQTKNVSIKLPFEIIAISEDFKGVEAAEAHFNNMVSDI